MRRRLLIIGPLPPPPGGGETVCKVLVGSNLREKYELHHFDITRRQTKENVGRFTVLNAVWALRYLSRLRRALREFRPDIVHMPITSNVPATLRDWVIARRVKGCGALLVMHSHSGHFEARYRAAGPLWKRFIRSFLSMADVLVCLSPKWKQFFSGLDLGLRIEVIYNPVDPDFRAAVDSAEPEKFCGVRVLFVGAVCEPKGVPELLDALETLMEERADLAARIVGHKQYPGHYERIVAKHGRMKHRDRIALTGPKFGAELAAEYKSADLFALPSHFEGVPMVIMEAMAAGLPVVATRVGGIPDIIRDGEHGFLVEPRSVGELAEALARLIDDAGLREKIGRRNRAEAVEKYSAEAFADACDRLYRSLLESVL
ncbi:MAG: glycosyltransferase family 4 protein [Armatimonadetes bacterium]|nr:glycosyltransferase family 4 protein [Armatimonadota bacterium]